MVIKKIVFCEDITCPSLFQDTWPVSVAKWALSNHIKSTGYKSSPGQKSKSHNNLFCKSCHKEVDDELVQDSCPELEQNLGQTADCIQFCCSFLGLLCVFAVLPTLQFDLKVKDFVLQYARKSLDFLFLFYFLYTGSIAVYDHALGTALLQNRGMLVVEG